MRNALYFGDCLEVLRDLPPESIDLIYLDPPFNSRADYNILFKSPTGDKSQSQIEAFEDTWHWGEQSEREFADILKQGNTDVSDLLTAMRSFLGVNDMMAYIVMMANRMLALYRVLKPAGSLYLHCDPTASHYLKILLDAVFSVANYRSEITWLRSKNPKGSQHAAKQYSPDTDIILFYSKTSQAILHMDRIKRPLTTLELELKYDRKDEKGAFTDGPIIRSPSMGERPSLCFVYNGYDPSPWGWRMDHLKLVALDERGDLGWSSNEKPFRKLRPADDTGEPVGNCWSDISLINPQAQERLGYPTQKPLALLERIIKASSNEGDVILDPFCGCGTAVHAAHKLARRWIGIDITHLAISLIEKRLRDTFPGIQFDVHGTPKDLGGAHDLALRDKYQFQWWACSLINAQPYQGKKKGSDGGIDGMIFFQDEHKGQPQKIIVSVKGGQNIGVSMIRDLASVIEREKAAIGLFITLEEPTKPMRIEAATKGLYTCPHNGMQFQRIQILTIKGLLEGSEAPKYVDLQSGDLTLKRAKRAKIAGTAQFKLE